jgi:hypothetical protein
MRDSTSISPQFFLLTILILRANPTITMPKNREEPLITRRECQNLALSIIIAVCVVPVVYSLSLLVKKYAIVLVMKEFTIMGVWWLLIPFVLGGVIVGVIIWKYAPEAEGPGLHIVIAAYQERWAIAAQNTSLKVYNHLSNRGFWYPQWHCEPISSTGEFNCELFGLYHEHRSRFTENIIFMWHICCTLHALAHTLRSSFICRGGGLW